MKHIRILLMILLLPATSIAGPTADTVPSKTNVLLICGTSAAPSWQMS